MDYKDEQKIEVHHAAQSEFLWVVNTESKYKDDTPSTPLVKHTLHLPYEIWGGDNRKPQNWYEQGKKSDIIKAAISKKARVASCAGWEFYELDSAGQAKTVWDEDLQEFEDSLNLTQYFDAAFQNLYWFGMFTPEIMLDLYSNTVKIHVLETPYFRFGQQDEYGQMNDCYLHHDWRYYRANAQKMPMLDPYANFSDLSQKILDENKANIKHKKYFFPQILQTPNTDSIYPDPTWVSCINGWLNFSLQIPYFKLKYIQNSLNIKYIIYIDDSYWEMKYGSDWKLTPNLQQKRKEETIAEIEKKMREVENAGNSLVTYAKNSQGTIFKGITVEEIERSRPDNKLFLEDVEVANLQMLNAIDFPIALMGNAIGKNGMGDNLGSGIRETLNFYLMTIRQEQQLSLNPLNFMLYHRGRKRTKIRLKQPYMQTLEDVTPSKRETKIPE